MRTVDNQVLTALHQIRDAIKNKDCCNGGGGNTPSGDITINDVVKFIHDKFKNTPVGEKFPYTTWNDIPDYDDANDDEACKTNNPYNKPFSGTILNVPPYFIGIKAKELPLPDPGS